MNHLSISQTLTDIDKIVHIIALAGGATWAYFKFAKGRVFHRKLEVMLSGNISVNGKCAALTTFISVKNVGLSRIDIVKKGIGLRVSQTSTEITDKIVSTKWRHLGTFPILEHHSWIEPGETITECRLILLPESFLFIFLEADVPFGKNVMRSTAIVSLTE
jgi:hypothetical protein